MSGGERESAALPSIISGLVRLPEILDEVTKEVRQSFDSNAEINVLTIRNSPFLIVLLLLLYA
jgi:hypothetical protein